MISWLKIKNKNKNENKYFIIFLMAGTLTVYH